MITGHQQTVKQSSSPFCCFPCPSVSDSPHAAPIPLPFCQIPFPIRLLQSSTLSPLPQPSPPPGPSPPGSGAPTPAAPRPGATYAPAAPAAEQSYGSSRPGTAGAPRSERSGGVAHSRGASAADNAYVPPSRSRGASHAAAADTYGPEDSSEDDSIRERDVEADLHGRD